MADGNSRAAVASAGDALGFAPGICFRPHRVWYLSRMGMFDFLKGNKATTAVWRELPEDVQPLFRGFEETGIAANEALVRLDPLVVMLRGRVESPELVQSLFDAIFKKNEKTHRLAGIDTAGIARFFEPQTAQAVAALLPTMLSCELETPFALVKHDAGSLQMLSMMTGAKSADAKVPMNPAQCASVTDLVVAGALSASLRRPLEFRFEALDALADGLGSPVSDEVGSFFGFAPDGQTLSMMPGGALLLLGQQAALATRQQLQAEGHAAQEFLPFMLAPPLIGAIDIDGRCGERGGVFVATKDNIMPIAPSVGALFSQWPQSAQRVFELARSAPR